MKFSQQLQILKNELNLSQREMCDALYGVPHRTLQSWLQDEKEPPIYVQRLILYRLKDKDSS